MKTWVVAGVFLVAGSVLMGSAFAQTTPAGGEAKDKAKSGRMAGGNRERVKAVQQALKDKGHDPGEIDGMMGPRTQAALKDFQTKEGLKSSGKLDAETMTKLGVQAKAGAAADSTGSSPSASPSASGARPKK
jgi:peptidoglycan hydrolase-like protein with peptidoglycan-binding domain